MFAFHIVGLFYIDLKILSLVFSEMGLEFHTFLSMLKAPLALRILDMMSESDLPAPSTTLPRYTRDLISSRAVINLIGAFSTVLEACFPFLTFDQ